MVKDKGVLIFWSYTPKGELCIYSCQFLCILGYEKSCIFNYRSQKQADWKSSASGLKLPGVNSNLMEGYFEARLARDLKIKSIPRYLLIDKAENIILSDAPRPSEPKLKDEIERLDVCSF